LLFRVYLQLATSNTPPKSQNELIRDTASTLPDQRKNFQYRNDLGMEQRTGSTVRKPKASTGAPVLSSGHLSTGSLSVYGQRMGRNKTAGGRGCLLRQGRAAAYCCWGGGRCCKPPPGNCPGWGATPGDTGGCPPWGGPCGACGGGCSLAGCWIGPGGVDGSPCPA
jgi:hypothetical protein